MIISAIHKKTVYIELKMKKQSSVTTFQKRYRAARLDKDMKGNIVFYV